MKPAIKTTDSSGKSISFKTIEEAETFAEQLKHVALVLRTAREGITPDKYKKILSNIEDNFYKPHTD